MYHDRVSRFIKCLHDKKQVEVFQWKKCSDRTYCTRYGCRPLKCVHAFALPLVYQNTRSNHYMCDWNSKVVKNTDKLEPLHV